MHSRSAAGRRSDEPEDDRHHLEQFAMPAADHLPAQLLVLGMVISLIALVVDSAWRWRRAPSASGFRAFRAASPPQTVPVVLP